MARFDFSRSVMEKILRRAFLDGVIELYENSPDGRIHSVALEGTLLLTINKTEAFNIKLFEIAQRAQENETDTKDTNLLSITTKQTNPSLNSNAKVKIEPEDLSKEEKKLTQDDDASERSCDNYICDAEKSWKEIAKKTSTGELVCDISEKRSIDIVDKDPRFRSRSPLSSVFSLERSTPSWLTVIDNVEKISSNSNSAKKSNNAFSSSEFKYKYSTEEDRDSLSVSSYLRCKSPDTGIASETELNQKEQKSKSVEKLPSNTQELDKQNETEPDLIVIEDDEEVIVKKETSPLRSRQENKDLSTIEPGEVWSGVKPSLVVSASTSTDGHPHVQDIFVTACPLCQIFCQGREVFLMHVDAHRQSYERVCLICAQGPLQLESLLFHLMSDHGPGSSAALLQQGQLISPGEAHEFKCCYCDRSFPTPSLLDQHLESHTSPQSQSSPHSSNQSLAVSSFSCELCGEVFTDPGLLASHHRRQHMGQSTSMVITDEDSESESGTDLAESGDIGSAASSSNKPTPFPCQHCVRSFRSLRSLKYHLLTCHGLQHACDVCLDAFPTLFDLQQHEAGHKDSSTKPVYRCSICNKVFASLTHCTSHKRIHTHSLSKPHVCDTCGSSFFKRGDLTKHMRTVHCPTKHFVCKVCGRTGTRADNMRVHVKIHQKFMTRDQIDLLIDEVYKT